TEPRTFPWKRRCARRPPRAFRESPMRSIPRIADSRAGSWSCRPADRRRRASRHRASHRARALRRGCAPMARRRAALRARCVPRRCRHRSRNPDGLWISIRACRDACCARRCIARPCPPLDASPREAHARASRCLLAPVLERSYFLEMSTILSGIQPSGELHIGNYLGAVKNWVQLQDSYDCIYFIADYHAIITPYEPDDLRRRTREMAISLFAAGLDPKKSTLFVQSMVPEHTELAWIFNTVTPLGELERQTQFKDKAQRQESVAAGLLNYPVLQAADILLYRADLIPVGEDQVQHLELAREIVRRWNSKFGIDFFVEPKPLLTPTRRIMGLDGQAKMSKSLGNTIGLLEDPA